MGKVQGLSGRKVVKSTHKDGMGYGPATRI